jgi:hypothetical protein
MVKYIKIRETGSKYPLTASKNGSLLAVKKAEKFEGKVPKTPPPF